MLGTRRSACNPATRNMSRRRNACTSGELPDFHAVGRRKIKQIALLDGEGVVPGIDIAHCLRAILARGVAIRQDLTAQRTVAPFHLPALGETQEELLLGRQRATLLGMRPRRPPCVV